MRETSAGKSHKSFHALAGAEIMIESTTLLCSLLFLMSPCCTHVHAHFSEVCHQQRDNKEVGNRYSCKVRIQEQKVSSTWGGMGRFSFALSFKISGRFSEEKSKKTCLSMLINPFWVTKYWRPRIIFKTRRTGAAFPPSSSGHIVQHFSAPLSPVPWIFSVVLAWHAINSVKRWHVTDLSEQCKRRR